jgi:hypothetical protein
MRRHVYFYTHLPQPETVLAPLLAGDPAVWLPPPAAADGDAWRVTLHAEGALPEALATHDARVWLDEATAHSGGQLRAVQWRSASADRLLPVLEGDLELAPLIGAGCHLALMGTYRPPLSVVGDAGDRLLGHRVAEACVRRFVLDVQNRLSEAVGVVASG